MKFSIDEKIANIDLATRLWKERVTPEQVIEGLEKYRCGTSACFGGHLATWPEFQALGVSAHPLYHWPLFNGHDTHVDEILFGDDGLFCTRGNHDADDEVDSADLNDYDLVLARLAYARAELVSQLAATQA